MGNGIGQALLVIGIAGVCWQCIAFVREVLPANYGSNPGFGVLERMTAPWFAVGGIGLGVWTGSWLRGVALFGIGTFCAGLLAMLLGRLFGGRKRG